MHQLCNKKISYELDVLGENVQFVLRQVLTIVQMSVTSYTMKSIVKNKIYSLSINSFTMTLEDGCAPRG